MAELAAMCTSVSLSMSKFASVPVSVSLCIFYVCIHNYGCCCGWLCLSLCLFHVDVCAFFFVGVTATDVAVSLPALQPIP